MRANIVHVNDIVQIIYRLFYNNPIVRIMQNVFKI